MQLKFLETIPNIFLRKKIISDFLKPKMPHRLRYGANVLIFQENVRDKISGTK